MNSFSFVLKVKVPRQNSLLFSGCVEVCLECRVSVCVECLSQSARRVGCWLGRGPVWALGSRASVAGIVRRPLTWHIQVHRQSRSFRVDAPIMGHVTPRSEKWTQNGAGHFGTAPCCPPDNKQKIFGISSCWGMGWMMFACASFSWEYFREMNKKQKWCIFRNGAFLDAPAVH